MVAKKPEAPKTSLVTCPGTVSYLVVWEPKFDDNKVDKVTGEPTPLYSCMFLFDKKEKAFVAKFKKACEKAFLIGVKRGWFNAKGFDAIKKPLRSGDAELASGEKEDPIYKGKLFFNCTTTKKRPDVKKSINGKLVDIEDSSEFYSGCSARVLINCYPFKVKGNKGIAAGLNGFLKLGDGTRLDGRPDPNSAFSEFAEEASMDEEEHIEDSFMDNTEGSGFVIDDDDIPF